MTEQTDAGAAFAPAAMAYTLSSGRPVRFVAPDLYALGRGTAGIPNEVAADILNLIYRGRRVTDPAQIYLGDQKHTDALFNALQLVMVPRLKLDDDDEAGVVDRREVLLPDLGAAYNFLLYGAPPARDPEPRSRADAAAQSPPAE